MRHLFKLLIASTFLFAFGTAQAQKSGTTTADEEEAVLIEVGKDDERARPKDPQKPTYNTIGITRASADFNNLGEAYNLDAILGIRIPTLNWLAVEINISQTLIPGENKPTSNCGFFGCTSSSNQDLRLSTIALLAAVKTPGTVYGIGKYGLRYIDSTVQELNAERSGKAWAAGIGYRFSRDSAIELVHADMADRLEYLTLNFIFGDGF